MIKFVFGMQVNIKVFNKLILSFLECVSRLGQSTQKIKFAYLCNVSRKNVGDEVDFFGCR